MHELGHIIGLDRGGHTPNREFAGGEPYRMQFELFFDRYEDNSNVGHGSGACVPCHAVPLIKVWWREVLF